MRLSMRSWVTDWCGLSLLLLGGGPKCQETIRDTIAQTKFKSVSKHFNDSLLKRGNTLQSDDDNLKLDELMALCTNLQNKVLDLEKTTTTQHHEIASLKKRVKNPLIIKKVWEVFVAGKNENVVEKVVDAAQVSTAATTVTITTEEISLAQALEALKTSKPKVKGIVFQEPEHVKPNKKDQIRLDEEVAKRIQSVGIEAVIDYALWEVIDNGATLPKTQVVKGVTTEMPITTAKEKAQRRLKDAKKLLEAVEKRFGRNAAIKKTQRNLLKQHYENFTAPISEMLDQTFDRHQKNKVDLDTMSTNDLYNKLKVYELEIKGMSSSSSSTQNMAFVSPLNNNTSSTNGTVNTAQTVNTAHEVLLIALNQPNSPQLIHEDLEKIHLDDKEEMDLRWKMAMLTIRARRFLKKTGRNLTFNGNETICFDKSNVECYNCHKRRHFSREYRAPRNQDNKYKESSRRSVPMETSAFTTLLSSDGFGGYDWSDQAEEGPNYLIILLVVGWPGEWSSGGKTAGKKNDEFVNKPVVKNYKANSSKEELKVVRKNDDAQIIKEWVSDNEEKDGNPQMDLQDQGVIDIGCLRHMKGNMSFLTDYKEIDRGYVSFGRNLKRGKITGKDHMVKVTRCDNGTEFKKREMNQFCEMNGILRQYSVAKIPQQNGVAERRNMTLIETARTMLANFKLRTTFWAEAVNTACYADEGFFVGYSLNSKAFRVFISRTRIVEENLHIRFSESTPNVVGNDQEKEDNELPFDPNIHALEDVSIINFSTDDEDDGIMADINNLDTIIQVSPILTIRIHKDHPLDQVIRDLQSATKTRKMLKNLEERGFIYRSQDCKHIYEIQKPLLKDEDGKEVDVSTYRYQVNLKTSHLYAMKRIFRKPKRKDTQVPQPSGLTKYVIDGAVYKELGDSLVRAATAASSLEAEQDMVPKTTRDTIAQTRRVKKLRKRNRSRTHKLKRLYKVSLSARVESFEDEEILGEDASKQERRIFAIDADDEITLVNDAKMFNVDDLGGEEVFVAKQNDNVVEEVVNAAQVSTAAITKPKVKGIVFQEPGKSTPTIISSQHSQDKGKGIMIKEHVKPKNKDQIRLDEEDAKSLQAEFNKEERLARERELKKNKKPIFP
uniref:Ribonuclease H-like domain-containing protein n=1 Tax=Tanacetum cinerariifolium TaxID=118510 RepID=A0A6L2LIK6_TANCI|nr:ribonuclease H-like domain-containing protein [Tanacetum cinerariifolium]